MTETITFLNTVAIQDDGWAHLAPWGDFQGPAQCAADGMIIRFEAVQRIDHAAAAQITNAFSAPAGASKRWRASVPIYRGHPDVPGMEARYPDRTPLGAVLEIAIRDNGLWIRPSFTNEGLDAVESGTLRAFSARWSAEPAGEANGKPVFRPARLLSAGLTDHPNLPVELMNEWLATNDGHSPDKPKTMNRETLIALPQKHGIESANDASDEQLLASLENRVVTLANDKATATTEIERIKTELKTRDVGLARQSDEIKAARTEFDNERKARIDLELELATAQGRITAAQRTEWETKLSADFANEQPALRKLAPAIKTDSKTGDLAKRTAELANAGPELTGTDRIAASIEKQLKID